MEDVNLDSFFDGRTFIDNDVVYYRSENCILFTDDREVTIMDDGREVYCSPSEDETIDELALKLLTNKDGILSQYIG